MSTIITPSEDQINIVITDDAVNVNVTNEPVVVNVTEEIIEISTASGAYPLPTTVYSVFGRTGSIIAQEGDYDLGELGDVTLVNKVNGEVLTYDGTKWINKAVSGTGTVTSVDMTMPVGLEVSGNPITLNGTLAVNFQTGYSIPTNSKQSNWDAAYNDKINSAEVTGTTTKTLTLTQQDGGTITASWTDINTNLVTSVNGYVGDVVLTTTDIAEGLKLYYTEDRVNANTNVAANTAARHAALTIGTANGLSLSSQVLSLALASASATGALSSTDWSTFNAKQAQLNGTGFVKASGTTISYDNSTYLTSADVSGYVPYTGATGDVNLGSNDITANAIIKNGGVDTQFLKADGSIDNNTYLTANDLPSTLSLYATNVPASVSGYFKLVTTIDDPDFNTTAVDISTGAITTTTQLIASLVSPANLIKGNPGVFNVTTVGNIKKVSGSGTAEFYFEIYKRTSAGVETKVGTSSPTLPVVNSGYAEFSAMAIWNDGTFDVTDTIVLKFYGARIAGGSNPTYNFQFGGVSPVRTIVPIPTAVIPNIYLKELADVEDAVASNNDGIFWDSTAVLWKNKTIAEVLTYTPANDATVVHLAGNETITGDKVFSGNTFIDTNHFNFKFQSGLGVTSGYMGFAPTQSSLLNLLNYTDGNNGTTLQLIYNNAASRQYHLPDATSGQLALTSQLTSFISLASLSATAPLAYNNTTGGFSISQAGVSGNGYLSSTDWNTFNAKQAAGNYITALSGEATASGPGSAAVTLSTSAVTGKLLTGVNITGGSIGATDSILVAFGKIQNQINGVLGGAIYQSTWNANTNSPTLTSGTGTKGYYYIVDVAGATNLDGITDWKVGDWAIFNGTTWNKVDNTDAVSSVNGFTGAVSLTTANITEGTNLYYTDVRVSANSDVSANTAARHSAVTLGTANGLSLSTQQLSLALASTTATGALSTTDWNTFNGKQNALTNPVTGTGTANTLAKWTGTGTINNSILQDDGTNVSIGYTTNPSSYKLDINGMTRVSTRLDVGGSGYSGRAITAIANNADYAVTFRQDNASGGGLQLFTTNTSLGSDFIYASDAVGVKFRLTQTGAATFSSSVTATNGVFSGGGEVIRMYGSNPYLSWWDSANTTRYGYIQASSGLLNIVTNTGVDINFGVGGADKMRINATTGNIGIGISNPGRQFQIGGTGSPIMSLLSNATGIGQGLLLFGDNNGDATGRIVYDFPTNALWFYTNSTKQLTIASTGAATFSASGAAAYGAINLVSSDSFMRINSTGGTADKQKWDIRAISATGSEGLEFRTINDANNSFSTKMWIAHSGNVGIGTSAPSHKLSVNANAVGVLANISDGIAETLQISTGSGYVSFLNPNSGVITFRDSTNAVERLKITSGGNLEITSGSIKTGSGPTMKFVNTYAGSVFLAGGYTILEVQVNGTTKYIPLYNGLN